MSHFFKNCFQIIFIEMELGHTIIRVLWLFLITTLCGKLNNSIYPIPKIKSLHFILIISQSDRCTYRSLFFSFLFFLLFFFFLSESEQWCRWAQEWHHKYKKMRKIRSTFETFLSLLCVFRRNKYHLNTCNKKALPSPVIHFLLMLNRGKAQKRS